MGYGINVRLATRLFCSLILGFVLCGCASYEQPVGPVTEVAILKGTSAVWITSIDGKLVNAFGEKEVRVPAGTHRVGAKDASLMWAADIAVEQGHTYELRLRDNTVLTCFDVTAGRTLQSDVWTKSEHPEAALALSETKPKSATSRPASARPSQEATITNASVYGGRVSATVRLIDVPNKQFQLVATFYSVDDQPLNSLSGPVRSSRLVMTSDEEDEDDYAFQADHGRWNATTQAPNISKLVISLVDDAGNAWSTFGPFVYSKSGTLR